MTPDRDCWQTPADFFAAVNARFRFNLDVCATAENAKCKDFISPEENALADWCNWYGTAWCNPGFSSLTPWMKKAVESTRRGTTVCVLSHASHTAQWAQFAMKHATELWLPCPRIQFVAPAGVPQSSNNRDSMLWIFTPWGNHGEARIKWWNWKNDTPA
jgi:DNA (cytosine-5)-methyltransferase 1